MRLKGITQLDKIINDFLEPFECYARFGSDFCYYNSNSLIVYSLIMPENCTKDFMDSIERWCPSVSMDIFLWSLLHELGHHETLNSLSTTEEIESDNMKCAGDYYNAPEEVAATCWAVEYAETHVEELNQFWAKLQEAILNFYQENHIELED